MAKKVKDTSGVDFFESLEALESEKGISKESFISALSNAIVIAYKRETGDVGGVEVRLDDETKTFKIYHFKKVVAEVTDEDKEISVEEANANGGNYVEGDCIYKEIKTKEFCRISAQTAKQVIMQKLREIEHENTVSEFEDKEGELMACTVRRVEDGNVYVEIGANGLEGIMMPRDQVLGEKYEVNQRINVFVKRVKNVGKIAQVVVSRSSNGLIRRLFENEVPEIKQGLVEIKAIAREPGKRTKIAIYSADNSIDAVGACVGNKGARVNAIVSELNGEKIDIIPWSENPLEFIARALSPAKVIKVIELDGENNARVIVPDDKLSLAIGKSGQNARLAVKLTGWKIDVKSESNAGADLGEVAEGMEDQAE